VAKLLMHSTPEVYVGFLGWLLMAGIGHKALIRFMALEVAGSLLEQSCLVPESWVADPESDKPGHSLERLVWSFVGGGFVPLPKEAPALKSMVKKTIVVSVEKK
jgi:hypothetical protein